MWHTKVRRSKVGDKVFAKLFEEAHDHGYVDGSKHTAAIVYRGDILAVGKNQLKTHPIMLDYQTNEHKIYLHAEIDAIVKTINMHGNEILSKCDIYVMRVGKNGNTTKSKPCVGCQKAIDAFGFKNVYWTE